jgi:hypothetical protein
MTPAKVLAIVVERYAASTYLVCVNVALSNVGPNRKVPTKFRDDESTSRAAYGGAIAAVTQSRTVLSPTRQAPVSWITHELIVSPTLTPDTHVRKRRVSPHFAGGIDSAAACSNTPCGLARVGGHLDTVPTKAQEAAPTGAELMVLPLVHPFTGISTGLHGLSYPCGVLIQGWPSPSPHR